MNADEIRSATDTAIGVAGLIDSLLRWANGDLPRGSYGLTDEERLKYAERTVSVLRERVEAAAPLLDAAKDTFNVRCPAVSIGGSAGYTFHRAVERLAWRVVSTARRIESVVSFSARFTGGKTKNEDGFDLWGPALQNELKDWPLIDLDWVCESLRAESKIAITQLAPPPPDSDRAFPPDGGWHFEPGFVWFRNFRHEITQKQAKVLSRFIKKDGRTSLGYPDLKDAVDPEGAPSDETIRNHVSAVRKVCAAIAVHTGILPAGTDPLPNIGAGWQFMLPRS